ncbi:MAG: hypothetical protein IJ774_01015 [Selenomonadaceae bacterium]|nr:hypothetical protein [Selenomonadaceae bacterium]
MRDLPRFIRLGDDRINVEEIVAYGTKFFVDEDGEIDDDSECLYVETKTSEFDFEYDEDDLGCSFDEKLVELDAIFLIAAHRPR